MRICVIYDCLFPWTIGGAERWYRNLSERLAEAGHEVTYLTMRQWDATEPPQVRGVQVIAVGPRMALYRDGKRRILPPLVFGLGVLWYLLRHPRRHDWVHTASFPFFSLLAAALVRPVGGYRIAVDWHEVWSRDYWREYLGGLGSVGWVVQWLCAHVPQTAYSFSRLHCQRLKKIGMRQVTLLSGEYSGGERVSRAVAGTPPTIVYAGRFIPEKRINLLVDALALVMQENLQLRAVLYGSGPDFARIADHIRTLGLEDRIELPGFVAAEELEIAMCEAVAIVQPSAREGYGMIVVEASARGVPVIVVAAPDNAATELVEDNYNGFAVSEARPVLVAHAILACIGGGRRLRSATRLWYRQNRERLSIEHSIKQVALNYLRPGESHRYDFDAAIRGLKSGAA